MISALMGGETLMIFRFRRCTFGTALSYSIHTLIPIHISWRRKECCIICSFWLAKFGAR